MADFAEEIERFLSSFSPDELAVMRHAFRAILDGQPATTAELPTAMGFAPAAVRTAVERLAERGILIVEPETGKITGARGLSLTETAHSLTLGGRRRYAFCAVDAVGIPVALGTAATIESRCHHCGTPLRLQVKDGAVVEAPLETVIWAVERDLTRSLRAHTWPLINFFCSVEHMRAWEPTAPRPGRMLTLQEAAALGPRLWGVMRKSRVSQGTSSGPLSTWAW